MSEYRRFISYVYEYPGWKKGANRGFLKVECRNGVCQMVFSLRGICRDENGTASVYGFRRDGSRLQGSHLADGEVYSGTMNLQLQFPEGEIGEDGYRIEELAGVIILCSNDLLCATQWDDEPLNFEGFPNHKPKEIPAKPEEPSQPSGAAKEQADGTPSPAADEAAAQTDTTPSTAIGAENEQADEAAPPAADETTAPADEASSPMSDAASGQTGETTQPSAESEQDLPGEAAPEILSEATPGIPDEAAHERPDEAAHEISAEAVPEIPDEAVPDISDTIIPEASSPDSKAVGELRGQSQAAAEDVPSAPPTEDAMAAIHATSMEQAVRRPNPYFRDGCVVDCVRITPRDIGRLQPADWHLANNRFVRYGFQTYGHLLIGRLCENNRMVLCVPGIYHQQERSLAKMYGFRRFIQCPGRRNAPRNFGYWCRLIQTANLDPGEEDF